MTAAQPPRSFGHDLTVSDVDLDDEEFTYRGERLTEERAGLVAAEAVKEFQRRGSLPVGRPSLARSGGHSPTLQVRVPESVRDAVVALAERRHVKPSVVIREALEEYLANTAR
jgi:hypothetical protein